MSAEEKNEDDAIKQVVDDDSDDSDDDEEDVLQCKLVVLGDGMVGKTSLIKQFVHGDSAFDKSYCQTIGLNFYSKDLELQGRGKDKRQQVKIRLQLWDIGGQSIGSKMIANYIFNANIVLLVYDGTNQSSFESLEDWYGKVKECQESLEQQVPCVALVGNKSRSSKSKDGDATMQSDSNDHTILNTCHCRGSLDRTSTLDGDPGDGSRIHQEKCWRERGRGGTTTLPCFCQNGRQRSQPLLLHGRDLYFRFTRTQRRSETT